MEYTNTALELLKQYATISNEIKALDEKKKNLSTQILGEMELAKAEKIETEVGTFSTMRTVRYEYPEEVELQIEQIKDLAKEAGKATKKESTALRFQASK